MRRALKSTTTSAPAPSRRWMLPWAISLGFHAVVLVALTAIVIGSGVFDHQESHAPVVIDFLDPSNDRPSGDSAQARSQSDAAQPSTTPTASTALNDGAASELDRRIQDRLARTGESALGERLQERLAPPTKAAPTTITADAPPASFLGLRSGSAGSIVYVVDASGSMIGTLPIVLNELDRSLRKLSPSQRYAVFFFQRNGVLPSAASELVAATPAAIDATLAWARRDVRPSGRSNPLAAMERSLALRPDVVFLLSTAITGSGEFEVSRDELLKRLDAVNPLDATMGRRPTRIQCVQFLDPDPLDTLLQIAERHGGADGFRFLSRSTLGLEPSQP